MSRAEEEHVSPRTGMTRFCAEWFPSRGSLELASPAFPGEKAPVLPGKTRSGLHPRMAAVPGSRPIGELNRTEAHVCGHNPCSTESGLVISDIPRVLFC